MRIPIFVHFPPFKWTRTCFTVAVFVAAMILAVIVLHGGAGYYGSYKDSSYAEYFPKLTKWVSGDQERSENVADAKETYRKGADRQEPRRDSESETFSEEKCPPWRDDLINVHFVLHSHDDPGWLKTPDQYYEDDVRQILNAAMEQLIMEPHRRFVYSEMYYFSRWWSEITDVKRQAIRRLVENGQLEFVGGGWVQNDDATTHYTAAIDQLAYGLMKIQDYFGEKARPRTGWQIDCFGYSQEQTSIFQQSGLQDSIIMRLPHLDIRRRRKEQLLEFLWKTSNKDNLFTHVLYDWYIGPTGFRFETEDNITDKNYYEKLEDLLNIIKLRSTSYKTNHLFFIMGHDFVYKKARIWFDSVDRLIRGVNEQQLNGSNILMFYSTPACYFKAVKEMAEKRKIVWPTFDGDFFPYSTNEDSYWTGFYSSRASLKGLVRKANSLLQTVQNFEAFASTGLTRRQLNSSRENLFTVLHHDGITGTCKQHVADEYIRMAWKSFSLTQKVLRLTIKSMFNWTANVPLEDCPLLNVSICTSTSKNNDVSILLLNGFSHERTSIIRLPVDSWDNFYDLLDWKGRKVAYQIVPVTDEISQLPKSANRSLFEIVFFAELPAFGITSYNLKKRSSHKRASRQIEEMELLAKAEKLESVVAIENEFYKLEFGPSGLLEYVLDKKHGNVKRPLSQTLQWYSNDQSGAYMLRPTTLHNISTGSVSIERVTANTKDDLVQEVRQTFSTWATQIIRLYKNKPFIEFEWTVGPLEPAHLGKEVISRFSSDLQNNGTFFTDANGRRVMQRQRIFQESSYPASTVYFPTTAMTALNDNDNIQMTVITDRPMGAASQLDGSLEFIVYRKVMMEDGAGMGEGIKELGEDGRPLVVRGKLWLTFSYIPEADTVWRRLAKEMFYEPAVVFSTRLPEIHNRVSLLQTPLPESVHLLTLQKIDGENSCLIRFEHYLPSMESDSSVTVKFEKLFHNMALENCYETWLDSHQKTKTEKHISAFRIAPMEIRTFRCQCLM